MDEDSIFEKQDMFSKGKKEKISYEQIVLLQMKKITDLQSKEFVGGHFEETTKVIGNVPMKEKRYIQDTREAFVNGINSLYDLLVCKFDKDFAKFELDFNKSRQDLIDDINNKLDKKELDEDKAKDILCNKQRERLRSLILLIARKGFLAGEIYEE